MPTEIDPPRTKRARLTNDADNDIAMDEVDREPTTTAPTARVTVFFTRVFESLPTPIKNLCNHQSKSFIKLQKSLEKLATTRSKFDDANFYPRSVRITFELKTSAEIQETAAFQTLQNDSYNATMLYKEAQKETMLAEIEHIEKKKQLLFFETLDALCELLLLDKGYPSLDTDRHALLLLLANAHATTLGKHLQLTLANMVASFERDYLHRDNPELLITLITQASRQRVLPLLADLHNLLKYIFLCSWDIILDATARRHNELKLQRAVQARLEGEATAAAAAVVDHEPPPNDMKTLKALITSMVGSSSNKILDKLNAIEQRQLRTPRSKNEQASIPSSNNTRNNQKKKQSKKPARPKSNDKAVVPPSATPNANTSKKKPGGRKQRPKKTKSTNRN
jgi:hypothetical protein